MMVTSSVNNASQMKNYKYLTAYRAVQWYNVHFTRYVSDWRDRNLQTVKNKQYHLISKENQRESDEDYKEIE